jgi:Zn ribbon nucleic-acid-binding protein
MKKIRKKTIKRNKNNKKKKGGGGYDSKMARKYKKFQKKWWKWYMQRMRKAGGCPRCGHKRWWIPEYNIWQCVHCGYDQFEYEKDLGKGAKGAFRVAINPVKLIKKVG